MALTQYLAITEAEIRENPDMPLPIGWMACHFSPYGLGLSNLPRQLPPGSLLLLDDITPIHGHSPRQIAGQLSACVDALDCAGVLLDFQRPGYPEAAELAAFLCDALPCPVCVSSLYGQELSSPVLLPPVPCCVALQEHLSPWGGRECWLELSHEGEVIALTEQGAECTPLPCYDGEGFAEEALHCHYKITQMKDAAVFTLWRTPEDQLQLLEEAGYLGIPCSVGLYQEFSHFPARRGRS